VSTEPELTPSPLARAARLGQQAFLSEYFVLYLAVLMFVVVGLFVPWMFTVRNFGNILSNLFPLIAVAAGQTFVLIVAGIDLSQVATMGVVSVSGGIIMSEGLSATRFSKSPFWGTLLSEEGGALSGQAAAVPVAILVMLAVGLLIGFINGLAVGKLKMPGFMVSLIGLMFYGALSIYMTKSENIRNVPEEFAALGETNWHILPIYSMLIAGALVFFLHFILTRTIWGRWFYATGVNIRAARVSGVPTDKMVVMAYTISGFCAAVGSILFSARMQGGRPVMGGLPQLLEIVGANVIAGISLFGGKGKVTWTFFGAVFFVVLSNVLNQTNMDYSVVNVVKGLVIVGAAIIDVTRTRIYARLQQTS
jgi:ribose transport system permease protein